MIDRLIKWWPFRRRTSTHAVLAYPQPFAWSGDPFDNSVIRSSVQAIARSAAKTHAQHTRKRDGQSETINKSKYEYLLSVRPNEMLDAYSFWQRVFTQLLIKNSVYIFIDRDYKGSEPRGYYIINNEDCKLMETDNGTLCCEVRMRSGDTRILLYEDMMHLRRDLYSSDYYGSGMADVLKMPLEVLNASNQGMINAVKQSATLRGILKFNKFLKPEDVLKNKQDFVKDYLSVANTGGIAALDSKADFLPLKVEPQTLNAAQINQAKATLYELYGINADFVQGKFSESTWQSVYESVIEPMLITVSLEATFKNFTEQQINHGNRIIFDSNRMQHASIQTKVQMINCLAPYGALTIDQVLEVFNFPTIGGEEGSKRLQSLNMVDALKANQYQIGDEPPEVKDEKDTE